VSSLNQVDTIVRRIELPTPFHVGTVNAFLIQGHDGNILVDCGMKYAPSTAALVTGLRQYGLEISDLSALVLTHGHVDHVGLSGHIQMQGVPIWSHPDVATWLTPNGHWDVYRRSFYERHYEQMGMDDASRECAMQEFFSFQQWTDQSVVDVILRDGESLPLFPAYQVIYVPGHAQAAIALWDEHSGDLIAGDQLLPHISSNALVEPMLNATSGGEAQRTFSLLDYRRNMQMLASLPINRVYPGHGAAFSDAIQLIGRRLSDQERRVEKVLQLVKSTPGSSAFALAQQMFAKHKHEPSLILSEVLGYLDWLAEEGKVHEEVSEAGTSTWTATSNLRT